MRGLNKILNLSGIGPLYRGFVTNQFHKLYYANFKKSRNVSWLGVRTQKFPGDLWVYQELLYSLKPDLVIECGSFMGGSSLYLATIFDAIGHGRIISIDSENLPKPSHPRITFLTGSSTAPDILQKVHNLAKTGEKIMVILDSDHRKPHVSKEMELYSPLVSPGQYLIVEDTNVNNHPVSWTMGEGPMEAVVEFLKKENNFEVDVALEKKFLFSANPNGFLRKLS